MSECGSGVGAFFSLPRGVLGEIMEEVALIAMASTEDPYAYAMFSQPPAGREGYACALSTATPLPPSLVGVGFEAFLFTNLTSTPTSQHT